LKEEKAPNNFLKYSSVGMQLLVVIGVCAWIGWKTDQYLELQFPVFMLTFIVVSLGGMMYKLYRSLNE